MMIFFLSWTLEQIKVLLDLAFCLVSEISGDVEIKSFHKYRSSGQDIPYKILFMFHV
ncbi:MAG: hypothetical protein WCG25_06210 [bacterium]